MDRCGLERDCRAVPVIQTLLVRVASLSSYDSSSSARCVRKINGASRFGGAGLIVGLGGGGSRMRISRVGWGPEMVRNRVFSGFSGGPEIALSGVSRFRIMSKKGQKTLFFRKKIGNFLWFVTNFYN